ncbi:hypothetical protein ABZ695_15015 [Streptomyces sp. NPDC006976]|uniref:hypothetical protein n=1 Tax=Streptomyces sp. NPDC006976 TaxID=3154311 RepID=UPI0033EFE837
MIEIGKVGRITAGDDTGRFVRIDELPDAPPSYLVLLARDPAFLDGCGDDWVENREGLDDYFAEARWGVEWISP